VGGWGGKKKRGDKTPNLMGGEKVRGVLGGGEVDVGGGGGGGGLV